MSNRLRRLRFQSDSELGWSTLAPEDLEAIHEAARLDREDLEGFEAIGGDRSTYSPLR